MYQIEAWSALRIPRREPFRFARLGIASNVVALGFTSLLTDVSSEMVSTVLPAYLVLHLGLTPLQFGLVEGLYHGVTVMFRLISGVAADRWQRHKEIAAAGYGISAVCKVGLAAAGAAWPLLASVVAVDRMGKGIRTASRDALISLSTSPANQAAAFGVHRAFDSAGAMLGPLVALGILALLPDRYDVVFVTSFSVAVVGLGVLLLFVQNIRPSTRSAAAQPSRSPMAIGSIQFRSIGGLTAAAALLGLTTIGDAFLYLLLQRQAGFNAGLFPLLYVGTAACYLVLAVPAGRLADRAGRRVTLLGGHALLLLAYLMTIGQDVGGLTLVGCLLLLGAYYAMTDGVLMALAGGIGGAHQRASAMAIVTTATSGARFVAAIVFGALWTAYDAATAVYAFSGALAVAMALSTLILRSQCSACEADGSST